MDRQVIATLNIIMNHLESDMQQNLLILQMLNEHYDDCNITFLMQFCILNQRNQHTRIEGYFEEWISKYIEYDFFSLFRMNRTTFQCLLENIDCAEYHKHYTGGEEQINAEKQLMMTLWWLGKGEVLLSVADKFNVAVSTVYSCVEFTLARIINLKDKYIAWPDSLEMVKVESDFRQRSGYPGVIGAIDVCNIPFKCPLEYQESYIDRKLQHSIKFQAITSANKIFTNISVGFPGSAHDSRVLRNSIIYTEVEENNNYRTYFPQDRYHIVGDSAYPLCKWLMTPYRDNGHLNDIERHHNTCHSITRIVVEHTFGILKSRWRILKYINVNNIEKAIKIIAACCVLHNFCYVKCDFWQEYEHVDNDNVANENARNVNINCINKRNEICSKLISSFNLLTGLNFFL